MMTIKLDERRRALARSVLSLTNKTGPLSHSERDLLKRLQVEMAGLEDDIQADARRKHFQAWCGWLRHGLEQTQFQRGITPEERSILERRDLGTGGAYPGSSVGFFAPIEFQAQVESAMKFYAPLLDAGTIHDTITGSPKGFPVDNDTSITGEQVDENAQVSNEDIGNLNQVMLRSFKYSSRLVRVSMDLVADVGFDLPGYLADRFGVRIARALNPKLTTGSGTTEPFGVVTQATLGAAAVGSSSNTGGSETGGTSIGTDDFAALEGSVDVAYRRNARWMLHPDTLTALRKVKNKMGQPVFPALHASGEARIMNYPIVLNPHMDPLPTMPNSPPVAKKTVLFGDFSKYVIRRVPPMVMRLEERFIDFGGQIAFVMFQRFDAALLDGGGGAAKVLTNVY